MGATVTPERSYEQRMEALRRANDIRCFRAELKRDLKVGRQSLESVVLRPPAKVWTMKVRDLLLAAPKHGTVKVGKILTRSKISPSKTVGGLSPRQRRELVSRLEAR